MQLLVSEETVCQFDQVDASDIIQYVPQEIILPDNNEFSLKVQNTGEISNRFISTSEGIYQTSTGYWRNVTASTSTGTWPIWYHNTISTSTTSNVISVNGRYYCNINTTEYIIADTAFIPKSDKGPDRTIKQSIKRAVKMLERFGLGDDVRMFMKGESIEISHPDSNLKFVITKNRSLIDGSRSKTYSSPFKTEIYTKDNIFIAQLCVYTENTPVLDHMLNLALHVKTGDEDIILQKANYTRQSDDREKLFLLANERPYLQNKLRIH